MKDLNKTQLINKKRTLSRLVAVQIMYQYEFFGRKYDIFELKDELIDNYALFEDEKEKSYRDKVDEIFIDDLVGKALESTKELDLEIAKYKKNADSDLVTTQILRLGAAELKLFKDTDFKVIISEYSDITGYFYEEAKVAFVSSVLNQLAKEFGRV